MSQRFAPEVAQYIEDMSKELAMLAKAGGLTAAAYALEIASLAASDKNQSRQCKSK